MKSFIFTLSFILFSFTLFAQNETEPNGSFGSATEITIGSIWQGKINEAQDLDYYKFTISEPGIIKLQVFNIPGNLDIRAFIYQPDQATKIRRQININNGQGYIIEVSTCQTGDHYLFLSDEGSNGTQGSQFNSEEQYSFRVDFTPFSSYDVCECENESFSTACLINLGDTIQALAAPWFADSPHTVKDQDYYKFNIIESGFIKIRLNNVPSNIELESFIYHPDQSTEIQRKINVNDGQGYELLVSTCEVGFHYLYFNADNFPYYNSEEQYSFSVEFTPFSSTDPCECNNSLNTACQINLCDTILATINPWFDNSPLEKDEDYYSIFLNENEMADILINSVPDNIGLCVNIYDINQSSIANFNGSNGQPINASFTAPADGTYYLKISDCGNDFNGEDQYILQVGCNLVNSLDDLTNERVIHLYPNPITQGLLHLQIPSEDYQLKITDVAGRTILQSETNYVEELTLDLTREKAGIYILHLSNSEVQYVEKVVVQK